ncbi:MAG: rhodanese-like domain-containing protein [Phycisphaerales bacterium]|nr:rhodanese-like domain-containing protein [Phycisphaerales bacterium]
MTTPPPNLDNRGLPIGFTLKPGLEISPRDAKARLETPGAMVMVDCRTQPEWDLVHIPGTIHIPLDQVEERHDEIELKPGQELAILCHHGVRSLKAALTLRALGHPNAVSVAGGIELWSLAADTNIPRYERGPGVLRLLPR